MSNQNPSLKNWLILILLSIVWGSSFILIKKGLVSFSGIQVGALRITIAFLFFLPIAFRFLKKVPKEKLKFILAVGLIGSFFPAFLFPIAQKEINSSTAGILNSMVPLFTYIWGIAVFQQGKNSKRLLGIFIGMAGAIALILEPGSQLGIKPFALFILLATIMYGLSSNIAKHKLQDVKSLYITSLSFFFVGIPAIAILFSTDFLEVMKTDEFAWHSLGFVSILAIVGTALSLLLFWKLVQQTDAIFGSMTTYLIPVVAIMWGLLDREQLYLYQYLGFGFILLSVFLVRKK